MNKDLIAEWAIENNDPRLQFLDEVDEALKEIDPEVAFWWDIDPMWSMIVRDLFVDLTLACADSYGDDGEGYNPGWVAIQKDGTVAADFHPYNYTNQVWTNDMDEFKRRIGWALEMLTMLKETDEQY